MRQLISAVVFVLAASVAVAQDPPSTQQPANPQDPARVPPSADETRGKKEMTAIVVSTDETVKTITVRNAKSGSDAQPETLTVSGAALSSLTNVKAGEKVKLVLSMDPMTNKQSVTSIEKDKANPQ
jgi:hypothetical protein